MNATSYMDPQAFKAWGNILSRVQPEQRVKIYARPWANPFEGGDNFVNLGVGEVKHTVLKYQPRHEEAGYVHHNRPTSGILITGLDYDTEGPEMVRVFVPQISMLTIARPDLPKEPGTWDGVADFLLSASGIKGMLEQQQAQLMAANEAARAEAEGIWHLLVADDAYPPLNPDHADNVAKLKAAMVTDLSQITPDTPVVNMVVNNNDDAAFWDMVVIEVIEVRDGVIIGFKDVGVYQGQVTREEMFARLLAGQTIPTPDATHYVMVASVDEIEVTTAKDQALFRLAHKANREPSLEPLTVEPRPAPEVTIDAQALAVLQTSVVADPTVVTPETLVVGITLNDKSRHGMIVTHVVVTDEGVGIRYRSFADYEDTGIATEEALIRLLVGETLPTPGSERTILATQLSEPVVRPARNYAAMSLLDDRESGRNPLVDPLPKTLAPVSIGLSANQAELLTILKNGIGGVLSPATSVFAIVHDGGKLIDNFAIESLEEVDGGMVLVGYDLIGNYGRLGKDVYLRLVAGLDNQPFPVTRHRFFIRVLESVTVETAAQLAARSLTDEKFNLLAPVVEQPYY